jgi:hypothetical protein
MEKGYWLGRKRASLKAAMNAGSAEARLIHYDLAGRYNLNAFSAEIQAADPADTPPAPINAGGRDALANECSDA